MNLIKLLITAAVLACGSAIAIAQEAPLAQANRPTHSPLAQVNKPAEFSVGQDEQKGGLRPTFGSSLQTDRMRVALGSGDQVNA